MDEIDWTTIELNILLESCLFGVVSIASEVSVQESVAESHAEVHEEFHYGPGNVEHHSIGKRVTNVIEP